MMEGMRLYISKTPFPALAFALACFCASAAWAQPQAEEQPVFQETVTVDAPALQGNLLGEDTRQPINVCLPPSYFSGGKRYPVVYYFHGFSQGCDASQTWIELKMLWKQGGAKEFILVGVNGNNVYSGSFWVNSPVTGAWEDFAVKDVVGYVDSHYRTLATRDARGAAGFSMGGFAALNLAFRHPDVFSATYASCPGLLAPGSLPKAFKTWDDTFKRAYAAAFAPDPAAAQKGGIPAFGGTPEDNKIISAWEKGFGDLEGKIDNYLALHTPLKAIRIRLGMADGYSWIPEGCMYFSGLLYSHRIPHEMDVTPVGHSSGPSNEIALFFSKSLSFE
jgi:pimeloyl-ACP methyl ester carboxylesterase